jgi:hypothetical protein
VAGFLGVRTSTPTYEDVRWTIEDEDYLAQIVAVVALGQAQHAAALIATLDPIAPAFNTEALRSAALASLEVMPGTPDQILARTWQRDGLLFEVLSWIALIEASETGEVLVRDPHLGSTAQGLDGLVLELEAGGAAIARTVIVEDKCSEKPRRTFQGLVLPAFQDHHNNERSPDLVATAANLLGRLADPTTAVQRAQAVLDINRRAYRASLALETRFDSSPKRGRLFKGYDTLSGIPPGNREGGGFVVGDELRPWFEQFAGQVRGKLEAMELENHV